MKIRLSEGAARSEVEIASAERALGLRLPVDFRRFVSAHDGAEADSNVFDVGDYNDSGVNQFIPLARVADQAALIENLSASRIPIAWAEGGNYVCLETAQTGGVFFWDHEEPHIDHKLAESFDQFLAQLEPD